MDWLQKISAYFTLAIALATFLLLKGIEYLFSHSLHDLLVAFSHIPQLIANVLFWLLMVIITPFSAMYWSNMASGGTIDDYSYLIVAGVSGLFVIVSGLGIIYRIKIILIFTFSLILMGSIFSLSGRKESLLQYSQCIVYHFSDECRRFGEAIY